MIPPMRSWSLALASCLAFAPARGTAAESGPGGASPLERALFEDVADRQLSKFTLLDAALIVSGVRDQDELESARARLRKRLDPILKSLDPNSRRNAAKALLATLHTGLGKQSPLLKTYQAHATTLLDVAESGQFNCVSATVLYLIAAKEAGIDVRAVLLPSHARASVVIDNKHLVVETTSRAGFDASAETSREVQRRFRPVHEGEAVELYADEHGTEVDDVALLGVVYTNLSVAAKERGDLAGAEGLDARAELFVAPSARPLLRQVRASMLGGLAIERLNEGRTGEAVGLAMDAALIVPPGEDARLAIHNLKAMAQRRLLELAKDDDLDEKRLLAFPDRFQAFPDIQKDLRSRAYDLVAADRSKKGDYEGAAAAEKEAARLGAGTRNDGVLSHNLAVAELNRLIEVGKNDPDKAWSDWTHLKVPLELAEARTTLGANIAGLRAQMRLEARRCVDLDQRVAEWRELRPDAPGDALRAACRNDEGLAHWKDHDYVAAAASFREAMRLNADEPAFKRNLVGALANEINKRITAHHCDDARPLISEGQRLAGDDPVFQKAADYCRGK
jgi:hypothetical protein